MSAKTVGQAYEKYIKLAREGNSWAAQIAWIEYTTLKEREERQQKYPSALRRALRLEIS